MNSDPKNNTPVEAKDINQIQDNIKKIKNRIIDSNSLFTMLKTVKSRSENTSTENTELRTQLTNNKKLLAESVDQRNELLKMVTDLKKSAAAQTNTSELENKIKILDAELNNSKKDLVVKNMYIEQLEASNAELKQQWEQRKSEFSAGKANEKYRSEINKKNQELKDLQTKLKEAEEENKLLQEEVNKLDEENMELRIESGMNSVEQNSDAEADKINDNKIKELENELAVIKIANHTLEEATKSLQQELTAAQEKVTKLEKVDIEYHKLLSNNNNRESDDDRIKGLEKQNRDLKRDLDYLKDKYFTLKEKGKKATVSNSTPQASSTSKSPASHIILKKLQRVMAENMQLKSANQALQEQLIESNFKHLQNKSIDELMESLSESSIEQDVMSPTQNFLWKDHVANAPVRRISNSSSDSNTSSGASLSGASTTSASKKSAITSPQSSISTNKPNFGSSGLIPPPPKVASTNVKKTKKPVNKLIKFANSKNPGKFITSSVVPVPVAPNAPRPHKRPLEIDDNLQRIPANITNQQKPAAESSSSILLLTEHQSSAKPFSNKPSSPVNAPTPAEVIEIIDDRLSKANETSNDSDQSKKRKVETSLVNTIEQWLKSGTVIDVSELKKEDVVDHLSEIVVSYWKLKSPSCPDVTGLSKFGVENKFTIEIPNNWTKIEKICGWYLALVSKNKTLYDYIIKEFRDTILKEIKIPKKECLVARYIRLLCMMTKSQNDKEYLLSITYEIFTIPTCFIHAFIATANIITCWKECIFDPSDPASKSSLKSDTLPIIMAYISSRTKTPTNAQSIYTKIAASVDWPPLERSKSMTQLVESNLLSLKNIAEFKQSNSEEMFKKEKESIVLSLRMIFAVINDWKITYNDFILRKLWPFLSEEVGNEVAVELLGSLGSLGVSHDVLVNDKPGVDFLIQKLLEVVALEDCSEDEKSLRIVAAESCIKLGSKNPILKSFL